MKSPISFFDRGVARNLLRRFWPLWALYAAALLLMLPLQLPSGMRSAMVGLRPAVDRLVLSNAVTLVYLSFFVGAAVAMAMFHYLYSSRSCGMMTSLPLRRETMYLTAWLTGLLPLLAADLLAVLVTAAVYLPGGYLTLRTLLIWLGTVVMANLCFYNFAVFCAMLTGNLLVLPLVYAVLNFTALVAENCVHEVLEDVVYGMPGTYDFVLRWLSPPAELFARMRVAEDYQILNGELAVVPDSYHVEGMGLLAAYCAVSLLFLLFGLWLYRRRRMESATDVVAIPVLKPVFKYCLSFGTALVFAVVVNSLLLRYRVGGLAEAAIVLALLLAGAFLGYYAAEMLIHKTLKVFFRGWKGLLAVCAALTLFLLTAELDLTGYERRIPERDEIGSVSLNGGTVLSGDEAVALVTDLHRQLLTERDRVENSDSNFNLRLTYMLRDGSLLRRRYGIPFESDPSLRTSLEDALSCQEAQTGRLEEALYSDVTVDGETLRQERQVHYAMIYLTDSDSGPRPETIAALTPQQAMDLIREGLLPDAAEGRLNRAWLMQDEAFYRQTSNVEIDIDLCIDDADWSSIYVTPDMDAVHTIRWLEENLGLQVRSLADAGFGVTNVSDTMVMGFYG